MVEGQPRSRFGNDPLQNRIWIVQQRFGGNAERFDCSRSQPIITHGIPLRPVAERVRFSINLNRQPSVTTEEVEDVRTGRVLAAELQAVWTLPEPMSEYHFGKAHRAPQLPRVAHRVRRRFWRNVFQHRRCPSTVLRTVPLPETSSGRIWSAV
jgi:hypothetical protein